MTPVLRQRPDGRWYIDAKEGAKRVKIPVQDRTGRPGTLMKPGRLWRGDRIAR